MYTNSVLNVSTAYNSKPKVRRIDYTGLTQEQRESIQDILKQEINNAYDGYDRQNASAADTNARALKLWETMEACQAQANAYREENGVATAQDGSASYSASAGAPDSGFPALTQRTKNTKFSSPINGNAKIKAQALTQQRVFERELETIRKELSKKDISDEQYEDLLYKQEIYKNGIAGLKTLMSNPSVADNADALQALDDKITDAKNAVSEMFNLKYGENMTPGAQSVSDFITNEDFSFTTKNKEGEVVNLTSKLETAETIQEKEDEQKEEQYKANKQILDDIKNLGNLDEIKTESECQELYKTLRSLLSKAEEAGIMKNGSIVLGEDSLTKSEIEKIRNNIFKKQLEVANYEGKRNYYEKGASWTDYYNWDRLSDEFATRHNADNQKLTDALALLGDYQNVVDDACDGSNDVDFIENWYNTIVNNLRKHGYKLDGIGNFDRTRDSFDDLKAQMQALKDAVTEETGLNL